MSPFEIERQETPHTRIKVIGVGGAGTNAVDYMVGQNISNVDFAVVNTDARVLERSNCPSCIHIGEELTHGLGAGGDPDLGYQCAEASADQLAAALENTDMLFISAGMGGGTGTGAAPVIARLAKEKKILTVAIVTKPFRFEGRQRRRKAEAGLERLREDVDTLIVISNDRLLEVVGRKTSLVEAFGVTNDVLTQSVRSISSLISTPGLINVDFADISSVMRLKGGAVMGVASAKGENRALESINKASSSSLLDKMVIDGAQGVLVCITGGPDLTLYEIDEAMTSIYNSIDEDADVIFGAVIDDQAGDEILVTLIATGFPVSDDSVDDEPPRRLAKPESAATSESGTGSLARPGAAARLQSPTIPRPGGAGMPRPEARPMPGAPRPERTLSGTQGLRVPPSPPPTPGPGATSKSATQGLPRPTLMTPPAPPPRPAPAYEPKEKPAGSDIFREIESEAQAPPAPPVPNAEPTAETQRIDLPSPPPVPDTDSREETPEAVPAPEKGGLGASLKAKLSSMMSDSGASAPEKTEDAREEKKNLWEDIDPPTA